jgi:hypothetical protein
MKKNKKSTSIPTMPMDVFSQLTAKYDKNWTINIICCANYFNAYLEILDSSGLADKCNFKATSLPQLLAEIKRFIKKDLDISCKNFIKLKYRRKIK